MPALKMLDAAAQKLWRRYHELGQMEAAAKRERKTLKDQLFRLIGKSRRVGLPDGSILERRTVEVPARQQAAFSYEKLVETVAVPKKGRAAG